MSRAGRVQVVRRAVIGSALSAARGGAAGPSSDEPLIRTGGTGRPIRHTSSGRPILQA